MPAKYLMSWEPKTRRWQKMYGREGARRRRFAVSCRQLGLPERSWTKELSYQAANAWWLARKAEIHRAPTRPTLGQLASGDFDPRRAVEWLKEDTRSLPESSTAGRPTPGASPPACGTRSGRGSAPGGSRTCRICNPS